MGGDHPPSVTAMKRAAFLLCFLLSLLSFSTACDSYSDEGCCNVCQAGTRACGDTCIDASATCDEPTGCACNEGGGY